MTGGQSRAGCWPANSWKQAAKVPGNSNATVICTVQSGIATLKCCTCETFTGTAQRGEQPISQPAGGTLGWRSAAAAARSGQVSVRQLWLEAQRCVSTTKTQGDTLGTWHGSWQASNPHGTRYWTRYSGTNPLALRWI